MRHKQQAIASDDPLDQLRTGWDIALKFVLKRPALYALLAHHARLELALLEDAYAVMQARMQRLVDMGRLRGPVEATARTIWAASQGALSLCGRV